MCDNYSKVNWANCVGKYNYVLLEQYINYYSYFWPDVSIAYTRSNAIVKDKG